jgi:hypothetical protein
MDGVTSIAMAAAPQRALKANAPTALVITPIAPGHFQYTRVRTDTGEPVWRWPSTNAISNAPIEAIGQILDLVA